MLNPVLENKNRRFYDRRWLGIAACAEITLATPACIWISQNKDNNRRRGACSPIPRLERACSPSSIDRIAPFARLPYALKMKKPAVREVFGGGLLKISAEISLFLRPMLQRHVATGRQPTAQAT